MWAALNAAHNAAGGVVETLPALAAAAGGGDGVPASSLQVELRVRCYKCIFDMLHVVRGWRRRRPGVLPCQPGVFGDATQVRMGGEDDRAADRDGSDRNTAAELEKRVLEVCCALLRVLARA